MKRRFAEAIISTFRDDCASGAADALANLTSSEWSRGLRWLDASGLALYLLARVEAAGLMNALPQSVRSRLSCNLADNRAQSADLFKEFSRINRVFHAVRLRYATLKGFSLFPEYCPDPALRCQFDFDFLIDRSAAQSFAEALKALGYQQVHGGEDGWEFKTGTDQLPSVRDLYKPKPQKSVELHFAAGQLDLIGEKSAESLSRLERRRVLDVEFPTLSTADAFLFQVFHLFHHIGSEWTRLSWLLELRHFVRGRSDNEAFWNEVRVRSSGNSDCAVAIGSVILLATMVFGEFAPPALSAWTVDALPAPVRLWIERYGWSVLLADFPGTKLYLLLRRELMAEQAWRELCRAKLLPFHRSQQVTFDAPDHGRSRRFAQIRFIAFRMRFHFIEGIRFLVELTRWNGVRNTAISHVRKHPGNRTAGQSAATRN